MKTTDLSTVKQALDKDGFAIIDNIFTDNEITGITDCIKTVYQTSDVSVSEKHGVRKIFSTFPGLHKQVFNSNIYWIVQTLFGRNHFLVKGVYFNKPPLSNWFVAYHQDLSVAVNEKIDSSFYKNWTKKDACFGVQPPVDVLESMYTIRIHLDDCTAENGALRVIPGSHTKGVFDAGAFNELMEKEIVCEVPRGGIMLMRPLLLHASHKNVSVSARRVLHLEFSDASLPDSIQWAEKQSIS